MLHRLVVSLRASNQPVGKVRVAHVGLLPTQLPDHAAGHLVRTEDVLSLAKGEGMFGLGGPPAWLMVGARNAKPALRFLVRTQAKRCWLGWAVRSPATACRVERDGCVK